MSRYRNILAAIAATCCISANAGYFGAGTNRNATGVSYGTNAATAVYYGSNLVWSSALPSGTTDFGAWFHVDASAATSFVLAPENGTNFVARWNDWRGNGLYSLSNSAALPYVLLSAQNGRNTLGILPYTAIGSGLPYPHLKWSVSSADIRSVFAVFKKDNTANFTPLIGSGLFLDLAGEGAYFVYGDAWCSPYIISGTNRVNGVVTAAESVAAGPDYTVVSLLSSGPLRADNFGLDRIYRSGGQYIAEMLIFTNAVSDSVVSNIESYLSAKWGIAIAE